MAWVWRRGYTAIREYSKRPVVGMLTRLKQGRESYRRRAWGDAYTYLSRADQATRLGAEDLELLALSAYMTGLDDEYLSTLERAHQAHLDAGAKRVRPMLMTVMTNVFGLLPILLDTGVGSDVAKRIAAPMWGGLVSLTILTLLVIPAVYVVWRSFAIRREGRRQPALTVAEAE